MWKEIIETNGIYSISEDGFVRNNGTNRILKFDLNSKGYYRVTLFNKHYLVHRLVGLYYVPNPDNKPQINHKDKNKLNNHYTNVEWCTNEENQQHSYASGRRAGSFTNEDVIYIRTINKKAKELAIEFDCKLITIYKIRDFSLYKTVLSPPY